MELLSQAVSQLSLLACVYVRARVWVCICLWNRLIVFPEERKRGRLMFAPWTWCFYIPLLSPGWGATGSSHREKVRRSLEGTAFRCVNTQAAIVWPEDRLNQYRGVTGDRASLCSGDYLECRCFLFLCVFWSCDGARKYVSTSMFISIAVTGAHIYSQVRFKVLCIGREKN